MGKKKSGKPLAAGDKTDGDGVLGLRRSVKLAVAGGIWRADFCQDRGTLLTGGVI